MAINLKDFPQYLQDAIQKGLDETLAQNKLNEIAKDLAEGIKLRTRLGQGLDKDGGEPTKLKALAESTKKAKRRNKKLSPNTRPTMSNLTDTGEMLDSITAEVNGTEIILMFKDGENGEKAKWNADNGRPFFHVSRVQIEKIENEIEKLLGDAIKNNLK